jgi:predicted Fe-Mo cluster-binding NifX family protein
MKMAIPVFNGRVAPVFDWAHTLIVIELDRMKELQRQRMSIGHLSAAARPQHLREMGVDVLICGGISTQLLGLLEHCQIRVFPWLVGEVEQVLGEIAPSDMQPAAGLLASQSEREPGPQRPSASPPRRKWCRTRKQ